MKALMIAAAAATASFALVPVAARAQETSMFSPTQVYGSVGYAGTRVEGLDLGAIQGRLGVQFGRYLGVEGELAGGVKKDTVDVGGTPVDVKLRHQEAVYGVGFLPVAPHFDLIGRVGYGHADIEASAPGVAISGGEDSWNYGAGAQYAFDDHNGVRADFTRHDFRNNGGNTDVWSVGYVRKF